MRYFTKPIILKLLREKKIDLLYSTFYSVPNSIASFGIPIGKLTFQGNIPIEVCWYHYERNLILYISYSSYEKSLTYPISISLLKTLESKGKEQVKRISSKFRYIRQIGSSKYSNEFLNLKQQLLTKDESPK